MKSLDPKFQAFATPGFKAQPSRSSPEPRGLRYQVYRSSYPDRIPPGFNSPCYGGPRNRPSPAKLWLCLDDGGARADKITVQTRGL